MDKVNSDGFDSKFSVGGFSSLTICVVFFLMWKRLNLHLIAVLAGYEINIRVVSDFCSVLQYILLISRIFHMRIFNCLCAEMPVCMF